MTDIQIFQNHRELFIQGSLGIPGLVQGPGAHVRETLRRVVIQAPPNGLNVDRATNLYDTIHIAPGTLSTMKFKLVGADGRKINLQGQNWSFSLVLFPRSVGFPLLSA